MTDGSRPAALPVTMRFAARRTSRPAGIGQLDLATCPAAPGKRCAETVEPNVFSIRALRSPHRFRAGRQGRGGAGRLRAQQTDGACIGLLPVVSAWQAYRSAIAGLVAPQPYLPSPARYCSTATLSPPPAR